MEDVAVELYPQLHIMATSGTFSCYGCGPTARTYATARGLRMHMTSCIARKQVDMELAERAHDGLVKSAMEEHAQAEVSITCVYQWEEH